VNGYKYGPYYGERSRAMYYNGALYTVTKRKHWPANPVYSHTTVYGGSNPKAATTRAFQNSIRLAYWPKLSVSYTGPWPEED